VEPVTGHGGRIAALACGNPAFLLFRLRPPSPFRGEGVGARERRPGHEVAVALEALDA